MGPFLLGLGGPYPHVSLAGGWTPTLWFPLLRPGKDMSWMCPWGPRRMVQSRTLCQGWPAAWMPTPFEANYAVQSKRTTGACGPPLTVSSQTLPTPAPSHPTKWTLHPGLWWSWQGRDSWWPLSYPLPVIINLLRPHSAGLQPIYSWLVLGVSLAVAPLPAGP